MTFRSSPLYLTRCFCLLGLLIVRCGGVQCLCLARGLSCSLDKIARFYESWDLHSGQLLRLQISERQR